MKSILISDSQQKIYICFANILNPYLKKWSVQRVSLFHVQYNVGRYQCITLKSLQFSLSYMAKTFKHFMGAYVTFSKSNYEYWNLIIFDFNRCQASLCPLKLGHWILLKILFHDHSCYFYCLIIKTIRFFSCIPVISMHLTYTTGYWKLDCFTFLN